MKIVRILPVPIFEDGEKIEISVKDEEEVREKWRKLLSYLRNYLILCKEIAFKDRMIGGSFKSTEDIYALLDLIVLFFKAPLFKEPLKNVYISPYKKLLLYKVFSLFFNEEMREGTKRMLMDPSTSNEKLLKIIVQTKRLRELFELLDNEELEELLLYAYTFIPSDTRPGFNYSSFIMHLLVSSALAWSISINELGDDFISAKIALAALLHDIGKPLDYRSHIKASVKVVRELLTGIVSDDLLDEIASMVEKHHSPESETYSSYIARADRISAGYERLRSIVDKTIMMHLKKIVGDEKNKDIAFAYKSGDKAWEFWDKIASKNENILVDLSRIFRDYLRNMVVEPIDSYKGGEIFLAKGDIRGIQSYVKSVKRIAGMMYSSMVVDFLVMGYIPMRLSEINIPYVSFMYCGGGNFLIVLPKEKLVKMLKIIQSINEDQKLHFPNIVVSYIQLPESISLEKGEVIPGALMVLLEQKLALTKSILSTSNMESSLLGIEYRCELCGMRPAVKEQYGLRICDECDFKITNGRDISFSAKWSEFKLKDKTLEDVTGAKYEEVSEHILEYISGIDVETLRNGSVSNEMKMPNIAILKIDGNLMGNYMSKSITFSDMIERSIRIDLALKRAWRDFLNILMDSLNERGDEEALKANLGLIYMGGDDALIILPAWHAIPASISLALGFYKYMGGDRALSLGIASTPPRHPLYVLIDAAESLLDYAKEIGRFKERGAIAFIYIENGTLTRSIVETILDENKERKVSLQPLLFELSENNIFKLLKILYDLEYPDLVRYKEYVKRLVEISYSHIERIKENKTDSKPDKIYRVSREFLKRYLTSGSHSNMNVSLLETIAYFIRQASRDTDYRVAYESVLLNGGFYYKGDRIETSFFDIAQLYKLLTGGFR